MLVVKLNQRLSPHDALNKISTILKSYDETQDFQYKFVDEQYAKKFGDEERVGNLATVFALLAIFISCLGLLGLSSYSTMQRTKEIGIRKVLGANVSSIVNLLSIEFIKLVLIALVIAAPIAWFGMDKWLRDFAYRTNISWWIFVVAALGSLIITLLTVSFQAIKAALMNPVNSLRSE